MEVSKNWSAETIRGVAGFELIVRGEANMGRTDAMPALSKMYPQGINPMILLLNLSAQDSDIQNFQPVQYNEKLEKGKVYGKVEVIFLGNPEATVPIKFSDTEMSNS